MMPVLIGALGIVAGTWLGAPTLAPIVAGLAIGLLWPHHAARTAALAGIAAWGGLLLVALLRGDDVLILGASLGSAMGLPGAVLFVATLLYPALLASSSAWLAHLVSPRRAPGSPTGALPQRGPSTS
jgi:hypothetical protein